MPTFQLKVKNNQETLDYILSNNSSVVRFGDGEVLLMCGKGIDYQEYSKELAENLRMILDTPSSEKLVTLTMRELKSASKNMVRAKQF